MEKKENKEFRVKTGYYIALLVVLVLLCWLHRFTQPLFSDDAWFATKLDDYSLYGYLVWRYTNWTSRLFLETFLVFLTHGHYLLWCILDTCIIFWGLQSIGELLAWKKNAQSVFTGMLLLAFVPVGVLYSAGWIATSTNYMWPLAFGLYALIPLRRYMEKKEIRKWEYVTFTIALILAANQEQMALLLLAFYLLTALSIKHPPKFMWVVLSLLVLSLFFIVTCPGNSFRDADEIKQWFPKFQEYNTLEKLQMGFLSTAVYYVAGIGNQILFPVFTGILAIAVCTQKVKWWKKLAAWAPVFGTVFLGFPIRYQISEGNIWHPSYYYDLFQNIYLATHDLCNYEFWQVMLETVCFFFLFAWIVVLLYWLWGKTTEFLIIFFAVLGGFASRIIVGLSPTIYASGYRTSLFCTVILQIVDIYMIQKIRQKKIKIVLHLILLVLLAVTISNEMDGKTY